MKCWHCNEELIWGGDNHIEDDSWDDEYIMQTILSCPECNSLVMIYYPKHQQTKVVDDG